MTAHTMFYLDVQQEESTSKSSSSSMHSLFRVHNQEVAERVYCRNSLLEFPLIKKCKGATRVARVYKRERELQWARKDVLFVM